MNTELNHPTSPSKNQSIIPGYILMPTEAIWSIQAKDKEVKPRERMNYLLYVIRKEYITWKIIIR